MLLFNPGLDFISSFFGCLYAGVTAVPAYPPGSKQLLNRLGAILKDCKAKVALTTLSSVGSIAERMRGLSSSFAGNVISTDSISGDESLEWQPPDLQGEELAFLQYTSGSTGSPKGVMVSHSNLIHNSGLINHCFRDTEQSVMVSWLPLFHDMGLVGGILQPLYVGCTMLLMAPATFLQRPLRWLKVISTYRATTSGGPNFAYDLCVSKLSDNTDEDIDLSCWDLAFSGAEPVRSETIDRFSSKFEPYGFRREAFLPCYGLAESTLIVSGIDRRQRPLLKQFDTDALEGNQAVEAQGASGTEGHRSLAACGSALGDVRFRVVSPDNHKVVNPGSIGEVWVSSPSVAKGYWGQEELSMNTFCRRLPGEPGAFLRTGDLGFLWEDEQAQEQLFITGRSKDVIIIRGRNLYPQDIETTAQGSHPTLRAGCGAAFSIDAEDGEKLIIVQELERSAWRHIDVSAVKAVVASAVSEAHEVQPWEILLLKPGTIPKTSSGKIQRYACRENYLNKSLNVVGQWQLQSATKAVSMTTVSSEEGPSQVQVTLPEITESATEQHVVSQSEKGMKRKHASNFEQKVQRWLQESVGAKASTPPEDIDTSRPLSQFGLDSLAAVQLTADLEDWISNAFAGSHIHPISPTLAYDYPTIEAIASHLNESYQRESSGNKNKKERDNKNIDKMGGPTQNAGRIEVAVVGISCRFPGASDPEEFWQLLCNGQEAVERGLANRSDVDRGFGMAPAESGGLLSEIDHFDSDFFGLSAREAEQMDPQQRLLMELSWEAFEHAGIQPQDWAGKSTGVFAGVSSGDYAHINSGLSSPGVYWGTGNAHSVSANRLSYFYDFRGPSMAVDTACSSSLVAVHLAVQSIQSGESDGAIAAGVNLLISPVLTDTFRQAGMLASDGRCKVFDADADGYVRGEGAGVLILRPLQEALRDNNTIFGVISGTAINQDGRSNGLTAPNGLAQQAVVRSALERAGVKPGEISYLEAHGTGTSLGDPIEVNALKVVFDNSRDDVNEITLGSVKANLGHLEAAAGVAGLIKVLLAMKYQAIPPQINLQRLNPLIESSKSLFKIPTQLTSWGGDGRHAGVSSFGFGGTNAHVVVRSVAPALTSGKKESFNGQTSSCHILTFSARSQKSLLILNEKLIVELTHARTSQNPQRGLASICYSANTIRQDHQYRLAVTGSSCDELIDGLRRSRTAKVLAAKSGPCLAFLFSGQGSQYMGMGQELLNCQPVFRATIEECDSYFAALRSTPELLVNAGSAFCDKPIENVSLAESIGDPSESRIHNPCVTQPALFAYEIALARLWQDWGIEPDFVLGHSVGEYAAACIAGVFSVKDGITLVASRARLMSALRSSGSMVAVLEPREKIEETLTSSRAKLAIAVENGPRNTVLSGPTEEIERFQRAAGEAGLETRQLNVSHGFHSRLMEPMISHFKALAEDVSFNRPELPIVSAVSGDHIDAEIATPEHWCKHILEPVRFSDSLASLHEAGASAFLEIGPKATLINLASRSLNKQDVIWLASSRPSTSNMAQMLESLAQLYRHGFSVNWSRLYGPDHPHPVPLPTYPWERRRYWIGSSAPRPQHSLARGEPAANILYSVAWRDCPLDHVSGTEKRSATGVWLMVASALIYERFASALPDSQSCVRIVHGPTFKCVSQNHWCLSTTVVHQWESLFAEASRTSPVLGVIHVLDSNSDKAVQTYSEEAFRVVQLAQLLLKQKQIQPPPRLWIVSSEESLSAGSAPRFDNALISGFSRTLALEQPRVWGGYITLPDVFSPKSLVLLGQELQSAVRGGPSEVGIRHTKDKRLVPRLIQEQPCSSSASFRGTTHYAEPRLDGHYLVSGGLGNLGMHTAGWLVEQGVRSLLLVGRHEPSAEVMNMLSAWKTHGVQVKLVKGDIAEGGTTAEIRLIIAESGLPLRGIIHAAGVLDDKLIADMTEADWASVIRPKSIGAWRLHELSLDHPVDIFLLFSSIASVIGSPGQAAYSAANAALDALAEYRFSLGLPALSVNWGPWRGGGFANQSRHPSAMTPEQRGVNALSPSRYLSVLNTLFQQGSTDGWHVVACGLDFKALRHAVRHCAQGALLSDDGILARDHSSHRDGAATVTDNESQGRVPPSPSEGFEIQKDRLLLLGAKERPKAVKEYLRGILASAFDMPVERLGDHDKLEDIGADSLMVMDIISQLQRDLDLMIYPREFYEHPHLEALASYLDKELDRVHKKNVTISSNEVTGSNILEQPVRDASRTSQLYQEIKVSALALTANTLADVSCNGHPRPDLNTACRLRPTLKPIIFILSSPRAGSTLLRVMLAGHSSLYSPPELHLLSFTTMGQRAAKLRGTGMEEGLVRALMDLEGISVEDSTLLVRSWEDSDLPIQKVYSRLQASLGTRTLVDKSPTYALQQNTLIRANQLFSNQYFIHLIRHPYAVIQSFVDLRMEQLFSAGEVDPYAFAESIWQQCNLNILRLQPTSGTPGRLHRVQYENLVTNPGTELRLICDFLQLPFEASLLSPYESGRLTDGLHGSSMSIGDPNFMKHQSIDSSLSDKWRQIRLPNPLSRMTAELAITLGYSLPHKHPSQSQESPWTPAREASLDVQGIKIGLCEWGPLGGPAVLCFHGILDQALIWEPIAGQLADAGFHIIAVDLRGHGRSDHAPAGSYQLTDFIRDAVGVIDALGHSNLTVIGHSLGSVVASALSRLRTNLVARLILIEPVLPGAPAERDVVQSVSNLIECSLTPPQHEVMPDQAHAIQRLRTALPTIAPGHAARLVSRGTVQHQGGCVWSWDPVLRPRTILNLQGGLLQRDAYLDLLSGLDVATLVIHGSESTYNRAEDLAAEQKALQKAHHRTLVGGHNLMIDSPLALADCILNTIKPIKFAPIGADDT